MTRQVAAAERPGPLASPPAAAHSPPMTPACDGQSPAGAPAAGNYDACVLSLVLGQRLAAPIYRLLDSSIFLVLASAAAAVGVIVGTVGATTSVNQAHDRYGRLSVLGVLVLPLYLQRLATMDCRRLHALLQHFETLFVLANWLVVFPCLGRVVGLGPGSYRLLYFCLLHLAAAPALLTDAARDDNLPHGHAFRNILAVATTIAIYCAWVYAFSHENVPGAFYDKPLLLREDRLAQAMGPARDVLTTRLFTLVLFLLKYLFNLVIYPRSFVLLTQPVPRLLLPESPLMQRVDSQGSLLTTGAGTVKPL